MSVPAGYRQAYWVFHARSCVTDKHVELKNRVCGNMQELEADFRGVREEVELKRRELDRVVAAINEIEFTRERKTTEFHRMQSNLMELLREQKTELDAVREKGVQLEVRASSEVFRQRYVFTPTT